MCSELTGREISRGPWVKREPGPLSWYSPLWAHADWALKRGPRGYRKGICLFQWSPRRIHLSPWIGWMKIPRFVATPLPSVPAMESLCLHCCRACAEGEALCMAAGINWLRSGLVSNLPVRPSVSWCWLRWWDSWLRDRPCYSWHSKEQELLCQVRCLLNMNIDINFESLIKYRSWTLGINYTVTRYQDRWYVAASLSFLKM